ncbi:ATP-binding protein [Streptomyces sp. NBC_00377]|uniref:ATP-binding protein n=1 Tax=unclassified Streptomyces TaxID=2593676 RepID=UPI002E205D42|nr:MULTISPECIES: ATP-binding protein [unclassified Streptomyces]
MKEEERAPAPPEPRTEPPGTPVRTAAAARARARALVDARWNRVGRPAREEDVIDLLLVVSELVTNALRHGGGLAGFEMTPVRDGIRLAVRDHRDEAPAPVGGPAHLPAGHRVGGYGWPLIVRLARQIVIDRLPTGGKTISVFLPVRTAGGPA